MGQDWANSSTQHIDSVGPVSTSSQEAHMHSDARTERTHVTSREGEVSMEHTPPGQWRNKECQLISSCFQLLPVSIRGLAC
jgi:hypothetical protein